MDEEHCWILQIKDTFSKRVWLYALKEKTAKAVAAKLEVWMDENGDPENLLVPLQVCINVSIYTEITKVYGQWRRIQRPGS